MICDDPFYTGICPARTEDGRCVSKYHCSHKVEPPKPPTNADRIRSMSDKELVRLRYRGAPHCKSDDPMKCNRHDFADGMSPCELCYYEWLQQPAEEDDHDERKENENARR